MKLRTSNGCSGCARRRARAPRPPRGRCGRSRRAAPRPARRAGGARSALVAPLKVTIRPVVAASSASSSSWRSSVRASRSPTRGSSSAGRRRRARPARELAVVEAEQADDAVRHRPHRHERADRRGGPCGSSPAWGALQPLRQQRADLVARSSGAGRRRHGLRDHARPGRAAAPRALPGVALARRRARRRRRRAPAAQAATGCGPRSAPTAACEPLDQLREPAGEVDGRRRRRRAGAPRRTGAVVLGHGDAEQHPVQARRARCLRRAAELERRAVRRVEAPADAAVGDPLLHPLEVVVVEPEAPPHGLPVGQVEHLRGGDPPARQVQDAATTPRTGLVWRSERSASRTCRPGSRSPAPNVAWTSGANVSMSGHITITSRGSSVGSASSACRIASWRTSTWRARPWQAWTATLRSPGSSSGRASARRAAARRAASGRRARRPGGGRGACPPAARRVVVVDVLAGGRQHELELPRVLAPGGEQAVGGQPASGSSPRRRPGPARPRAAGHSAGRRVQHEHVDVARGGERAQHLEPPGGQAREAEHGDPLRQRGDRRLGPQPIAGRREPLRPGRRRRSARAAGATAPPASASRSGARRVQRPTTHHRRAVQRVAVEQVGDAADGAEAAPRSSSVEVRGQRAQPRLAQHAVHQLQQRPHHPLRPPRIRVRVDPRGGGDRVVDQRAAARGTRRWRTRRPRAPASRRAGPTAAAPASAPSRAWGRRPARRRTGRPAAPRAGRRARRRGRRPSLRGGRAARCGSSSGWSASRYGAVPVRRVR